MNKILLLALGLALVALSSYLVQLFRGLALAKGLLDRPNDRSSHIIPTPKGGGIVFVGLWCVLQVLAYYWGYLTIQQVLLFLPGTVLVALLGFWDDLHELSAKIRFAVQCLAAGLCVGMTVLICPPLSFFSGVLLFFILICFVWSINLFNFMDGLDGIAAVEAVFVLGVGGLVCWHYGIGPLALIAWSMACLLLGFLTVNCPKASVFMGGVGSYALGFLIGALAWVSAWVYEVPIVLWILLYGVFWFDATVTLLRRMLYKKAWTSAHRSHAYQRLHQAGFSHQQVLFCVIGLNILLSMIVFGIVRHPEWTIVGSVLGLCVLTTAYGAVEYIRPMD